MKGTIHLTLGPRVLKTGISVTLALYICTFFKLEPAVFAGVAAIFTIQPSIYRTWKQISDQLKTNTLGAAIALFCIYFLGNSPIITGLVMIIVILISLKMKMESTISLTLVTVLAIMSAPGNQDFLFTLNRFGIILIGMGSAFLVNLFIFPPKYKRNYFEKVQLVFRDMSLLIRTAVSNEMTEKSYRELWDQLEKNMNILEESYRLFNEERANMTKVNPIDGREIVVFKQMLHTLKKGVEIVEVVDEHYFQSKRNQDDNQFFDGELEELIKYHEYLLLKYEGKIKQDDQEYGLSISDDSQLFLENVMAISNSDQGNNLRLVVIGSAIFEYSFQLQRLEELIQLHLRKRHD
ncbi:aromatic acid exporter family protein [Metabacillus herbersteinensis]|uniref:Aromatic acid exporter family protein n=1 Tax=Metabacillus herbersteinensis TaxID=283816 RepID=A0ABV6GA20_9BACI